MECWQPGVLPKLLSFSRITRGSFLLFFDESVSPSAQLASDFFQHLRKFDIFFRWDKFIFPSNLREEFQNIMTGNNFSQKNYFLVDWQIGGGKSIFKNLNKKLRDFLSQTKAFRFGNITA